MLAKCFFIRKHDVIQLEKIKREYYETIFHYIVFNILYNIDTQSILIDGLGFWLKTDLNLSAASMPIL